MVKDMFIEIRLCYLMIYIFKEHVKFNVSDLYRPKIMGFL